MRLLLLVLGLSLFCLCSYAQTSSSADRVQRDTTQRDTTDLAMGPLWRVEMQGVVVSATRSVRALEYVPMPVSVIEAEDIAAQGALRLSDLIANEPGLQLNADHGTGVQIQGLGTDYALILIDGEPVVGRTAGTLDLDRIAVANVERVEVVRGPSSSLYGSEALAGVINVITRDPRDPFGAEVYTRYGTHHSLDLGVQAEGSQGPVQASLFVNRYESGGYDLSPSTASPTVPSFTDYMAHGTVAYDVSSPATLTLDGRIAHQDQTSTAEVTGEDGLFDNEAERTDWSVTPALTYVVKPGLSLETLFYGSGYHTNATLTSQETRSTLDASTYDQYYGKVETTLQASLSDTHLLTTGAGYIAETVRADRVDGDRTGGFVFVQDEWRAASWLDLVPSVRLDAHSDYANRLSPNLAILVRAPGGLRVRASVGSGYKAPAFRQLYLSFTNPQAGYTVFGADEVQAGLTRLNEAGLIQTFLREPSTLGQAVEAERSLAFNVGLSTEPLPWASFELNVFHNEVTNLIDTQPVAQKTNGQQVFTYFNLNEVFTQGLEAGATLRFGDLPRSLGAVDMSFSYTYLNAKDREVLRDLKAGRIYRRTAAGRDVPVSPSDYGGLVGRSTHAGAVTATYRHEEAGFTANLQAQYRGRYGFNDINGNGIVDVDGEYAPAYAVLNATLTQKVFGEHALQVGVKNLTDHTDPAYIPSLSGREWFAGLTLNF